MMTLSKALLLLPVLACIAQSLTPLNDTYASINLKRTSTIYPFQPKIYNINLDLSYEDRWREVMSELGQTIPELFDVFWAQANVSESVINYATYEVIEAYDQEYAKELKAIATLLNLPFAKIAFFNAFFDVTTECLGIIVQDAQNNIYHARNLDFAFSTAPIITRMMFHGRYIKDGKVLFEAVTKVGQLGLLTGIKNGKFSITLNQNMAFKTNNTLYWKHIKSSILNIYAQYKENYETSQQQSTGLLKKNKMPLSPIYIARRAIETTSSYEEMIEILKNTPTLSRVFYLIAGIESGQGTVITKFGNATEDVSVLKPDSGIWYLIQSNYVSGKPDAVVDNRKDASIALLNSVGRANMTKEVFFDVMNTYPLFNNGTIHTTVMQGSMGYINTTIWGWSDQKVAKAVEENLEGVDA